MVNGGELLETVKALNADGELSSDATVKLTLAVLGDTLVVAREIKNDNIEIKGNIAILVEKQGKNKEEIDNLRKRSLFADVITAIGAAIGIFLGVNK